MDIGRPRNELTPSPCSVLVISKLVENWGWRCLKKKNRSRKFKKLIFAALQAKFNQGIALQQQGRLADAERIYREVLRQQPNHFGALHLLGLIALETRHTERAVELIGKAIALKPDNAKAHYNRGLALVNLKRPEDALESYGRAIALNPDFAEAHNNRGNALSDLKRFEEALASYDKAIALNPDNAETYDNRGLALSYLKRPKDALESYDRAIALNPDFAKAHNNRGNALQGLKRHSDALASYDKAVALNPDFAEAHNNRGNALQDLKRYSDALASYDKAIGLKAGFAEAYNNRGNALNALKRHEEALASCDKAIAFKSDDAEAHHNRGIALFGLGRNELALASYERALAIEPKPICHSNLIYALNFEPTASAARLQAERARWNELYAQQFAPSIRPHNNDPDPNRRLRVGYVSSHFRYQASIYAFGGVLLCHDPTSFEVVCYSDTLDEDDVTARLRARSDKWHRTVELSDDNFADLVRADGIDILVDCVGHMGGHRLLVFARKPAPIQVTAWGEPTGTGLKAMDYLLADPVLVPASERALLAERVFDLPNFLGYWVPDPLPEPVALPAIANGYVTFGSFNRLAKIQDPVLRSWATVLRGLPNARLVLKCDQRPF